MFDKDKKWEILRRSRCLKGSRFDGVFIKADLTPFQQERDKQLRNDLKRRKENGEDVVLFRDGIRRRTDVRNFHRGF